MMEFVLSTYFILAVYLHCAQSILNSHSSLVLIKVEAKEDMYMQSTNRNVNTFLYAIEAVGLAFVGVFLAAYLLGLPTTTVYHSEPAFRTALSVLGVLLIALVLAAAVVAAFIKRKD